MNSPSKHSRKSNHSHVVGMYWATRVFSIGLQMAVMPGLGFLADRYFETTPWLTVVGACLGFGLAMLEVFRLAEGGVDRSPGEPVAPRRRENQTRPPQDDQQR